jgi:hypothetical protein
MQRENDAALGCLLAVTLSFVFWSELALLIWLL